ncbi:MAG: discoidin domain-containing protein, partial [Pseudomonadota bacterium]
MSWRLPLLTLTLIAITTASSFANDTDGDGVADDQDNCVLAVNPGQQDADGNAVGDACDADLDNDCDVDFDDVDVFRGAFLSSEPAVDFNSDGIVNFIDLGILKSLFRRPLGPSAFISPCATLGELPATATATSQLQPALLAVDGNLGTRWESVHGVDPVSLTLDLGRSYALQSADLHWEAANADVYRVEGSNDAVAWTLLAQQSSGRFGDRTDHLDLVGAWRYLRLTGEVRSPGNVYGYSIWELDVHGDTSSAFDANIDRDGDGVIDAVDECPDTPPGDTVDGEGCTFPGKDEVAQADGYLVGGPDSAHPGFTLYVFD